MFPHREFKPYLRPGQEHIQEFDAKVITYCDPYVITSLNADWILEPHCFQTEELRVRADGHFGYQDCFQWPQAYSQKFEYAVCILNPQKMREQEDPSKTLWELWTPTEDDFDLIDPQSPFCVGKFKHSIYYNLYRLYDSAQEVVNQWKVKQEGKKDIVTGMVLHSCHLLNVLKHHPLTFPDVVVYVAELQRFLLDIIAHMLLPRRTNHDLMGCFTEDITTCKRLFHASSPVWLVWSPQFIPQDMNIINVVTVTRPDHIVQKNFVHNGVVTMFPTLHLGRGGTDRHFNSRRTFRVKVLDVSDATSSVVIPQQSAVASSSQTASASRNKVHNLKSGRDKWAEGDATIMLLPFPQWVSAFKRVDKDPARVKTGLVDTSYRFPEPAIIVAPVLPERRKLYCANWLAARPLWISRIDHHPPSPLPVPQTWREVGGEDSFWTSTGSFAREYLGHTG
ncbi:hypothetical protein PAXRUDRAFT_20893 [Paxillus rubicundulus Ve08.2h10]|uniref:Uncharacterized protein n=1 Tax=Paxillus rubicundulus Ve08.2h10 TaxID=930991 RepID=A0A0D0CD23_9AGAM|nr:hypothetical protein PAXRUDRAFT_20893 [Paxillus rubicundulus Ve08.2h10]